MTICQIQLWCIKNGGRLVWTASALSLACTSWMLTSDASWGCVHAVAGFPTYSADPFCLVHVVQSNIAGGKGEYIFVILGRSKE